MVGISCGDWSKVCREVTIGTVPSLTFLQLLNGIDENLRRQEVIADGIALQSEPRILRQQFPVRAIIAGRYGRDRFGLEAGSHTAGIQRKR